MKLSIIIVNYNVKFFLEQCLHSCNKAIEQMRDEHPNWEAELFVVDNNSVDGSVEMVRERFPKVKLIDNKDNKGFSRANNQALRIAKGEYQLLLNPDTVVEEDTFLKSVEFMDEHPDAGVMGVKMIDGKGKFLPESKRGLPAPDVAFYKIFGLSLIFPKSRVFGKYHLGYLPEDETHKVDVLAGAFMLLRKETLDKTGLLDETFFMYGEDIDLSHRIKKAGYENYYYPGTRIIHYKGESTKKDSVNYVFVFYNAMIIFAKKHFTKNNAKLFSFLINGAIWFRAGISILIRFIKNLSHPFLDWSLMLLVLTLAIRWYEGNIKFPDGHTYPDTFYNLILPIYALIWVASTALTGAYKWIGQARRVVRGVLIGAVLVSILYAFLDESLRFSRAGILLGAASALVSFLITRWVMHLVREGNPFMGRSRTKRMLIVGGEQEGDRVAELLEHSGVNHWVIGKVSPDDEVERGHLGNLNNLDEIVKIHKVDEVIFCAKDLPSSAIFNAMLNTSKADIYYKIVPEASVFIIGSNSKNEPGDYYTIDVKLALKSPEAQFNKRVLDIAVSLVLLLLLPLAILFVRKRGQFVSNLFNVLSGKLTWVGYSVPREGIKLPQLRRGVLNAADRYKGLELEMKAIERIDMAYARNYHISQDLDLILRGFSRLGG